MINKTLKCVMGEVQSMPDLDRIQKDLEIHKDLWDFVLYEGNDEIPRSEVHLPLGGHFTVYLFAGGKPNGQLMTMASEWLPTSIGWLDCFGKLDYLVNILSDDIMSENAILMISWDEGCNG